MKDYGHTDPSSATTMYTVQAKIQKKCNEGMPQVFEIFFEQKSSESFEIPSMKSEFFHSQPTVCTTTALYMYPCEVQYPKDR